MRLRDHDQPCEHGNRFRCISGCPGGREVNIDYEAAARRLVEWAYEPEGQTLSAEATIQIVDAALGVTE